MKSPLTTAAGADLAGHYSGCYSGGHHSRRSVRVKSAYPVSECFVFAASANNASAFAKRVKAGVPRADPDGNAGWGPGPIPLLHGAA